MAKVRVNLITTIPLEVDTDKMKNEGDLKTFLAVVGTLGLDNALPLYSTWLKKLDGQEQYRLE